MVVNEANLRLAVGNIARYGDTDVFPFPLETHWFHDDENAVIELLKQIDTDFDAWMADYPIISVKSLASVGYWGFRAATQIDPIWNAYLLGLIIQVGSDIESARVPTDRATVHAYRYSIDTTKLSLFSTTHNWSSFQRTALTLAKNYPFVLSTDISDFYSRIYHHRLENALQQATQNRVAVARIMAILFKLSSQASYGLPVGGHASRLLAELLLNRVDRLLQAEGVTYLRFVDDYYLFSSTREETQRNLVFLSNALLHNEGLGLSRSKTRFMTQAEFMRSSPAADPEVSESASEHESRAFLRIRLAFDRYSPNADEQYESLKSEVDRYDIIAMLAREFEKSRIDEILVRHLAKSIRFIEEPARSQAAISLAKNLSKLYPVFPTVTLILIHLLADFDLETRKTILSEYRTLVGDGSHIVQVPTNLSFAIRMLANDPSEEVDTLLVSLHGSSRTDMIAKRDIILAMSKRRVSYWLSDVLRRYALSTPWEKRALIVSSYVLGDEGRHWRDAARRQMSLVDQAFMRWVGGKNNGRQWDVPL